MQDLGIGMVIIGVLAMLVGTTVLEFVFGMVDLARQVGEGGFIVIVLGVVIAAAS